MPPYRLRALTRAQKGRVTQGEMTIDPPLLL